MRIQTLILGWCCFNSSIFQCPRSPPILYQPYTLFPFPPPESPVPSHKKGRVQNYPKATGSHQLPRQPHYSFTLLPQAFLCLLTSLSTGRIWLDNLSCRGTEGSVTECASRGWGNSDCTHDEDAGVICKDQRLPGFSDSNVIEVCSTHTHARVHTHT